MIKITTIDDISFELEAFGRTVICPKGFRMIVINDDLEIINKDEKEDVLVPNTDYSEFEVDGVTFNNIVDLQLALYPILFSSASGSEALTGGSANYSDLATSTIPISFSADTETLIPNDKLGAFTNESFLPSGVTSIFSNNQFDLTQLKVGDKLDIRLDVEVTTNSQNQNIMLYLALAIGGFEYTIPFEDITEKTSGLHRIVRTNWFDISNANTLDNPAEFRMLSDGGGTIKVNGWNCFITQL